MKFEDLRVGDLIVLEQCLQGVYRYSLEPIYRVTKTLIRLRSGLRFRRHDGSATSSTRKDDTVYRVLLPSEENKQIVLVDAQKLRTIEALKRVNWHRIGPQEIIEIYEFIKSKYPNHATSRKRKR